MMMTLFYITSSISSNNTHDVFKRNLDEPKDGVKLEKNRKKTWQKGERRPDKYQPQKQDKTPINYAKFVTKHDKTHNQPSSFAKHHAIKTNELLSKWN